MNSNGLKMASLAVPHLLYAYLIPDSTSSVQHNPDDHVLSSDACQLQHDPDNFSDEESSFPGYNSFPEKGK